MGNIIKLSVILFLVGGIAAGTLAFYNSFTKPEIKKLKAQEEAEARQYVLKGLFNEDVLENLIYDEDEIEIGGQKEKFWKVKENKTDANYKAYVFLSKGSGFSGTVETMVGTDAELNINSIKVLKHTETPGLGAESQTIKYGETEPFFETWFKGKNSLKVVVEKDDSSSKDKVQSLTGATITTRAVCKSIKVYAEEIKKKISEQSIQVFVGDFEHVIVVDIEQLKKEEQERNAKAESQVIEGGK